MYLHVYTRTHQTSSSSTLITTYIYCVWICIRVQCAEERNANQCAKNYKEKPRTCLWDIDAQAERYHRSISTYFHFDWLLLAKSFGDPLIYICTHTERTRSFFCCTNKEHRGFRFFVSSSYYISLICSHVCVCVVCVLCCADNISLYHILFDLYADSDSERCACMRCTRYNSFSAQSESGPSTALP